MRSPYFKLLLILLFFALVLDGWVALAPLNPEKLRDGDLLFHTSLSTQSKAILLATRSVYSHMGIVKKSGGQTLVVEAAGPVKETLLESWIHRGLLQRVSVARHRQLTEPLAQQLLKQTKQYYGQPYDPLFLFNNGRMYCSELPYLTFQKIELPIGRTQTISELYLDNRAVEHLMQTRWKGNPACKNFSNLDACKPHILAQVLITPVSLLNDDQMDVIYSNYPPIFTGISTWVMSIMK